MANAAIDTSELEYLKSCRDKLQDIAAVLNIRERQEQKDQNKKETLSEEKLKEIEKIIKS